MSPLEIAVSNTYVIFSTHFGKIQFSQLLLQKSKYKNENQDIPWFSKQFKGHHGFHILKQLNKPHKP